MLSCLFSVRMYFCTAFSAVFDWICALQVIIILIIIIIIIIIVVVVVVVVVVVIIIIVIIWDFREFGRNESERTREAEIRKTQVVAVGDCMPSYILTHFRSLKREPVRGLGSQQRERNINFCVHSTPLRS